MIRSKYNTSNIETEKEFHTPIEAEAKYGKNWR